MLLLPRCRLGRVLFVSVQIHAPLRVPPAPRIGAGRVLVRSFSQRFILYVPARTLALWYLYCCSLPYFTITSAYILRLLLRTFCFRTLVSLFRRGFVPIDFPSDCVFLIDCPSDCFGHVLSRVLNYKPMDGPFHFAYCCLLAPAAAVAYAASEPNRSHAQPARCEFSPEVTPIWGITQDI